MRANLSQIAAVLCVLLLAICLILTLNTVSVLRNAAEESHHIYLEALALFDAAGNGASEPEVPQDTLPHVCPTDAAASTGYYIRETNDRIAIYTAAGELVTVTELSPKALPLSDQTDLQKGIYAENWTVLQQRLMDLGG